MFVYILIQPQKNERCLLIVVFVNITMVFVLGVILKIDWQVATVQQFYWSGKLGLGQVVFCWI
jgi:hypothetical protein